MKKIHIQLAVISFLIISIFLVKAFNTGQLKYIYAYLFTDYKQTLDLIGKRYDISIIYNINDSFIETALKGENLENKAKQISDFELSKYSILLPKFFSKYPDAVIKNEMETVKLSHSLTLYGVSYGGTSIGSTLYLTNSGVSNGYTDLYIEELFHHEFSSILMRKYNFPTKHWASYNQEGFHYAQSNEEILRAIKEDTATSGSNILYKNGFLTKYSMSTLENDVNTYAETLFTNPTLLKELITQHPVIKNKLNLLEKFYLGIDSSFSVVFDKTYHD